ncbi:MAG: RNA polymerase subunit sigma [Bacteroidetes bacterium GWC2_33_15]|nr:MAG: RNA polymerase subunit sigma [Bacteroidetes bacterium GWA2_33_15]OFX51714.1 MAG: RNA polymerase subunit sigma [Bacteroidetes bacterium GWC2_33_15]OFX66226.1 MAG: RNA polymerase subunit sigma [Bacteroidetes bacterium GWB2_32_14]OFX67014.1 MAG: RNA polymerase subunit sigma [Bacteroidetes bacterium GWD2_33_33]HAN17717.1 RNA polymerase subunit sigma [Bacteroidales bacterium]
MSEYSDNELLTLFRDSENRNYAFNLIVRKYQQKLYWHIRKIVIKHDDADDILQNTFIKVWKGLDGFREDSKLYTWLYRIATNESLTFLKQQKTKYLLPLVDYENQLKETLVSDQNFNGDEIQLKLQKAILGLPEKQRIVFNMKYFEEMKYEEMAEILSTSVGALKASYHHAVKKIEKYFNED